MWMGKPQRRRVGSLLQTRQQTVHEQVQMVQKLWPSSSPFVVRAVGTSVQGVAVLLGSTCRCVSPTQVRERPGRVITQNWKARCSGIYSITRPSAVGQVPDVLLLLLWLGWAGLDFGGGWLEGRRRQSLPASVAASASGKHPVQRRRSANERPQAVTHP